VSSALPAITGSALATQWALQPVAVLAVLAMLVWYARGVRTLRSRGEFWPRRRSVTFLVGVGLFTWTTCGFPQAYANSLFWTWTAQTLALLLVVPVALMAGQPVELARRLSGDRSLSDRFLRSEFGRLLGSPLVGPALIPVLAVVLFFGPVPGWSIEVAAVGWLLQPVLIMLGSMIVLPLVSSTDDRGSLAVGLAMSIGFLELLLDAIPGIVLRLQTSLTSTFFDHRALHSWSPTPLHDQQVGGSVLWCVAEILDLPFLLLVFRRWVRADAREAAEIDTVLDAERIARSPREENSIEGPADQPWWVTDREMQNRMRRR